MGGVAGGQSQGGGSPYYPRGWPLLAEGLAPTTQWGSPYYPWCSAAWLVVVATVRVSEGFRAPHVSIP